ncbi:hypothetical protein HF086_002226 [Spodoptera exigua]|uniref:Transposable element P transposase-like RNase H domain-containing protein n=1 Tax=Spodoptera exigua TaxID=7107 RepID=A0A922SLH2_SPOEX|nr:hypothetical protein HF086_002226 [Spodoptera exigua]
MLCQRHFKNADFADDSMTKLLRTAIPNDGAPTSRMFSSVGHSQQKPLCDISNLQNTETAPQLNAEGNEPVITQSTVPYDHHAIENFQPVAGPSTASPSQAQQTRENKLFGKCRKYMQKVCQLRNRLKNFKKKEILNVITEDIAVKKLSEKITPAFSLLLQGQIRNFKKKVTGRRWSKEEKITALRIYKRSPTCYRLLRRLFPLPSISTLKTLLRKLPFGVGINKPIFTVLKRFAVTQAPSDTLMFDEMSIKKHLQYNPKDDIIEGYQDHGTHGRSSATAML